MTLQANGSSTRTVSLICQGRMAARLPADRGYSRPWSRITPLPLRTRRNRASRWITGAVGRAAVNWSKENRLLWSRSDRPGVCRAMVCFMNIPSLWGLFYHIRAALPRGNGTFYTENLVQKRPVLPGRPGKKRMNLQSNPVGSEYYYNKVSKYRDKTSVKIQKSGRVRVRNRAGNLVK